MAQLATSVLAPVEAPLAGECSLAGMFLCGVPLPRGFCRGCQLAAVPNLELLHDPHQAFRAIQPPVVLNFCEVCSLEMAC